MIALHEKNTLRHLPRAVAAVLLTGIAVSLSEPPALADEPASHPDQVVIKTTMTVDLLDRVLITAAIDGVIKDLSAREGEPIEAGQTLVQLDTERLEKQFAVAQSEYNSLRVKSQDNSREQSGLSRHRTAQFNVQKLQQIKSRYGASVPALEFERAVSSRDQAMADVEGARKERMQFEFDAESRLKGMDLIQFDIEKSKITSPFHGAFSRIDRHPGEFVKSGETIAELYRLDRLTGVVLIDRQSILPQEAPGTSGVFQVPGDEEKYKVTIDRVLPRVDRDGKYRAYVVITNLRSPNGRWRLLPGIAGNVKLTSGQNPAEMKHLPQLTKLQ